jgi:hypothetical protein
MGVGGVGIVRATQRWSVGLLYELFAFRSSCLTVNECPWTSAALMLLGVLVVTRLVFKTLYVLTQIFLLPGASVSSPSHSAGGCY